MISALSLPESNVSVCVCSISFPAVFQMEFDEKELRKEISYAIKNIHGIRHVRPSTYSSLFLTYIPSISFSQLPLPGISDSPI